MLKLEYDLDHVGQKKGVNFGVVDKKLKQAKSVLDQQMVKKVSIRDPIKYTWATQIPRSLRKTGHIKEGFFNINS